MSRRSLPKQFLPLLSERSLLQETVERLDGLAGCAAPIVISNHEHRFIIAEQLKGRGALQILEPVGRNTAPALAVAALQVLREHGDGLLLTLASDHSIVEAGAFREAALHAARIADAGMLTTFGIRPTRADTGYGYIELGDALAGGGHRIARFVEKPDAATARRYLESGRFLWNSGMFMFSAQRYLDELARLAPDLVAAARASLDGAQRDLDFLRLERTAFEACRSASIDYAVMEKTAAGAVLPADIGWSDVGSWSALWDIAQKDAAGNACHGDVRLVDAAECYVRADKRLVIAVGIRNTLVVETDDAVLVSDLSRAQEVKAVVEGLDRDKRGEHLAHRRVYRPWGYYESIDAGAGFQVKRIMVKAGEALSLQLHRKRAEHWIVVSGRARVTRGEDIYEVLENQSTFIPVGTKHRLENPADQPLYLIEVQSGTYLGEDDIVRFEDRYKRD
jgi:mannose-1-phosphate guanylyltransferase/mannose-6-phosphate isomerase